MQKNNLLQNTITILGMIAVAIILLVILNSCDITEPKEDPISLSGTWTSYDIEEKAHFQILPGSQARMIFVLPDTTEILTGDFINVGFNKYEFLEWEVAAIKTHYDGGKLEFRNGQDLNFAQFLGEYWPN